MNQDEAEVISVEQEIDVEHVESELIEDLMASYRVLMKWHRVVDLYERLPEANQETNAFAKQAAHAYSELGNYPAAIELLEKLTRQESDSEAWTLLANVYKRLRQVDLAINAFERAFQAGEQSDIFAGAALIRLLVEQGNDDARVQQLVPLMKERLIRHSKRGLDDVWSQAVTLELAFVAGDEAAAAEALGSILAEPPDGFVRLSVGRALSSLKEALRSHGQAEPWMQEIVDELEASTT